MKKKELLHLYDKSGTLEKWQLIKKAVEQDITEVCPMESRNFWLFSKEQKAEALHNKKIFKLIWHYWIRRIPLLAPLLGKKYLPLKSKEYYKYRAWYYEYLEPVIDIKNNFLNYEKVFKLLADEKSKDIFCDILMARITKLEKYYRKAYEKSKEYQQYFALDVLPQADANSVYVDCGGYTGDTAERFIKCYSEAYKSIYIYEPDPRNAFQAKKNLEKEHDIYVRQCGVGRDNQIAYFNSKGTQTSSIQKKGIEVKIVSLDKDVNEDITFIKMDIEGEESNAIAGAKRHILEEKPICAICLYHKMQDIWKLPLQIMKINPDYKLYLRHYMENYMETVAYFI